MDKIIVSSVPMSYARGILGIVVPPSEKTKYSLINEDIEKVKLHYESKTNVTGNVSVLDVIKHDFHGNFDNLSLIIESFVYSYIHNDVSIMKWIFDDALKISTFEYVKNNTNQFVIENAKSEDDDSHVLSYEDKYILIEGIVSYMARDHHFKHSVKGRMTTDGQMRFLIDYRSTAYVYGIDK